MPLRLKRNLLCKFLLSAWLFSGDHRFVHGSQFKPWLSCRVVGMNLDAVPVDSRLIIHQHAQCGL
jgi:hypothetical protein